MDRLLKKYATFAIVLLALVILPQLTSSGYYLYLLGLAGVYTIMAISLNLLTGVSGQISIGHGALMAIGAYSSALLTLKLDFPLPLSIIAAGLIAGLLGGMFGFPALRLKGHFLALATLGASVSIFPIATKWESLTNGVAGLHLKMNLLGYTLDSRDKYYVILFFCIVILLGTLNLMKTKPGRALIALRDSEVAARAMGVNITYYKVAAFVISSFIAGIGGGLYANLTGYINPEDFTLWTSINILLMVVIGGIGSIPGAVLGAIYLTILPELTSQAKGLGLVVTGTVVIFMLLFFPKGLIDLCHKIIRIPGRIKANRITNTEAR